MNTYLSRTLPQSSSQRSRSLVLAPAPTVPAIASPILVVDACYEFDVLITCHLCTEVQAGGIDSGKGEERVERIAGRSYPFLWRK